jgi:hypothetical protein
VPKRTSGKKCSHFSRVYHKRTKKNTFSSFGIPKKSCTSLFHGDGALAIAVAMVVVVATADDAVP